MEEAPAVLAVHFSPCQFGLEVVAVAEALGPGSAQRSQEEAAEGSQLSELVLGTRLPGQIGRAHV